VEFYRTKKRQFAHKSFPGDERLILVYHWTGVGLDKPFKNKEQTQEI
jgi:hypothetical protein